MNSNRMKYSSTPTYGMQKRNFAKKPASAQVTPAPDFTQQPNVDLNTPFAPIPAQNPFMAPQGTFPTAGSAMGAPMIPGNQPFFPTNNMPLMPQPPQMLQMPFVQSPPAQQFAGSPLPQMAGANNAMMPPLMNSGALQNNNIAAAGMYTQGFVPPALSGSNALAPNVMRSDPMYPNSMPSNMQYNQPNQPPNLNGFAYPNQSAYPNPFPEPQHNFNQPGYAPAPVNMVQGGAFQQSSFAGLEVGVPAAPTPRPPMDIDKIFKAILYGVLPALFIPSLFVTHTFDFIRYLFIALAVIVLSIIWYRQSFTSGVRTMVSVVYLALSIIVIAMLITNNTDLRTTANPASNAAGTATEAPAPSPEVMPAAAAMETEVPAEGLGESEAEQRLITFMENWSSRRFEEMVSIVQPSWATLQDNPAAALFTLANNRVPQSYSLEGISGTAADSSRSITMSAYIDKSNGKDPVRYRFMILMVKENGEWYVDPNTLATNDADPTATPTVSGKESNVVTLAPRMTVTPAPDPATTLYYNTGGKYYHVDANCSAINEKYRPLTNSFSYSELRSHMDSLAPCLVCGAPIDPLPTEAPTPSPEVPAQ